MRRWLFWKQLFFIIVGLPMAALSMIVIIRFFIFAAGRDLLPKYDNWSFTAQSIIIIIELNIFGVMDNLHSYLVEESAEVLCEPLYKRYFFIGIYATIIWLASMCHLVVHLWGTVDSYELDMIIQLLVLSVCMGIMMGVALPYCSNRFWVLVWQKLFKGLKSL